jgi:hypothetical protein
MTFKILIDECLSPSLVQVARDAGHHQSTCVRDIGLAGMKDWDLVKFVVAQDFTLVTNNAKDFRGDGVTSPGGWHARQAIHAGLVCLNSAIGMDLGLQEDLFRLALEELVSNSDMINKALELTVLEDEQVDIVRYEIVAI